MKKKIIIAMAAIAAAFTMVSCNKELVESEKNTTEGNSIITASTESALTKTSLSGSDSEGYDVVWSEDDQITIGGNTFTLIEGANTTTGKFQGTLPEGDGPFYAYYPAEYNGTDWPTTQVYTEGNITGSPMKAEVVKGAESLSFKNEGGILRLSLKGTDQIRRIIVTADGLNDITLECGSGVTLDPEDGKAFHIAMPEGEYEGTTISVYTTDFDGCTKKLKDGKTLKIERSKITTASFTVSFPAPAPIASLTGAFSIAEDKQVCFSRGNLYYDDGFKFESRQCNFHGYDYYSNTWGLFGWSTEKTNYGMSTSGENSSYSGDFVDWGKAIGDGDTWRTLTSDEWQYLFVTRPNAADKYGYGRVYGTEGLIILPDEFTDPKKNGGSGAFVPEMGYSNSYTLGGNWEAMEAAGAVFLPIAGFRGGSEVYSVKDYGMYWSSSAADGEENAYEMDFQLNSIHPAVSDARRRGHSVRLVEDVVLTVTFDMNGHGTAPDNITLNKYGSKINKPSDPVAEGSIFAGWYKDETCTKAWDFGSDVVTANITLYAKWVEGVLSGKFSVSETKKVYFSKGNLWSDKEGLFYFEDNQYDYNSGDYDANHVSHFMWSKDAEVARALKYNDTSASESDVFFTNATYTTPNPSFTANGQTGMWRTLSKDEWEYLIENNGCLWTTINGVNGLIIFCDGYSESRTGLTEIPYGCAFLPAAGYRNGVPYSQNPASVRDAGSYGFCWSASPFNDGLAHDLDFHSGHVYPSNYEARYWAQSVRLVTESK